MSAVAPDSQGGKRVMSIPESFESSMCCAAKPSPPREVPVVGWSGEHKEPERRTITKLYVILNPFGGNGRGRRAWAACESVFQRENAECVLARTEHSGHATELARTVDLDTYDGVVAIGGDGTISEVINGLMTRAEAFSLPFGMIPGGTGNSFATSLNLLDPVEAAEVIVHGFHTPIDIGRITCGTAIGSEEREVRYMFNLVGWGLGVDANATAESLRCCGKCRYDVGAFVNVIKAKKRDVRIDIDGERLDGDFSVIMILNNQHTGTALRAAPSAVINDGRLDVVMGNRRPRMEVIDLFNELKRGGSHVYRKEVDYRQFRTMTIDSQPPTQINVDGENLGATPATVETVAGGLQFFVARPMN